MQAVVLRAYNLVPGAAFTDGQGDYPGEGCPVWIVMSHVQRDANTERIRLTARRADVAIEKPGDTIMVTMFDFDYNQKVALVGICVNPDDLDDSDWGSDN